MNLSDKSVGRLTTHVLDTANGKPASGLTIKLYKIDGERRVLLKTAQTNNDGRVDAPLLAGEMFEHGIYELVFNLNGYYKHCESISFLNEIPIRFGVNNADEHYHVPLLVSPFGYSTYRGS